MNIKSGKKVCVWALALCMTFSTMGVTSAESANDYKDHWAEGTISSWMNQGLVTGYEDGMVRPDVKVSRQEFTALVNRSFGFVEPGIISFADVVEKDWSYADISKAQKAGYVLGYADGTFKPKQEMSRQEVAVIVAKLLGLESSASAVVYADGKSIPEWSNGAIGAVIDHAMMVGYPDRTFRPLQSVTRAEAITILDKALKVKAEQGNGPSAPTPTAGLPSQPTLATATVAAGENVGISAPLGGTTAWLAPAGTSVFAPAANMTRLVGNGDANIILAPTAAGAYKLFLVNAAGVSLASVGTITVGLVSVGPAPVSLGMAGNYAILAKTGISSVPSSVVTGNIGVSPIDSTAITGFSLTVDATNEFSISSQLTGKAYASDYASPTSSNLTTAISDMETAYTDAAGRTADYTELYAGDISGQTLTAGTYKWGTNVLINSNVILHGGANDVWVFQVAKGVIQASGTRIILTGGAQAKNIIWQAAETVSIGTDAHFEGTILGKTNITLGTNATIKGRLLAQTSVTLDKSIVVAP
ncbi:MAG: ice-binding family protein [Gorillibacterium sp.]|nr:ice-binding family protein [Gorillibacterium sp.]